MSSTLLKRTLNVHLLLILFALPLTSVNAQAGTTTRVGFFEAYEITPGGRVEVPVEVRDVEDLYGIDIEIRFDPTILEIEDTDPDKPGVQPGLGTFLDAGLTLMYEVDNEEGRVHLIMTQVNPAEPKSGDGVILVLYFIGLQEGETELAVDFVELSTNTGEAIAVEGVNETITVSSTAVEKASTPVPVQNPAGMTTIPTLAPTAIPPTPTPTTQANDEPTAISVSADISNEEESTAEESEAVSAETASSTENTAFSLLNYWWVVLIVIVLAGGLAFYLWKTK